MSHDPAVAPASGTGRGRPVLAVDVGGTHIKVAVLDESGRLGPIARHATPRDPRDPGGIVVAAVASAAADLSARGARFSAVGLAVPGIVDDRGMGVHSTNLGWRDFPFTERAAAAVGLPVAVVHDVRAAGLAEHRLGAARGAADAAIVTLGTGIAAALIIDGRPYTGRGYAGELGHSIVDPTGPSCRCGQTGCLEAIASARAIVERYRAAGGSAVDAAEVVARAQAGDPPASRVWQSAIDALAYGLAQVTALLAPEVVVLGGGLSESGDALLHPLRESLRQRRRHGVIPRLERAALGQDAGTWGAAIAARDLLDGRDDVTGGTA